MYVIRSLIHLLFMGITLVPWALAVVLVSPVLGKRRLYWMCVGWLRLMTWSASWMMGVKKQVHGLENVPQGQAQQAVLLVKHQSTWETFAMPTLVKHPLAYVFKKELLRIPFFGWAIGSLDMIYIDRSRRTQAFQKLTQQGRELLAGGTWVIMFPEGTRVARGHKGKYQTGGARLAVQTGAPVIPVAVTSAKCWPPRALFKRPGVVHVSFGPLMPSEGRDPGSLMRDVEAWIEAEMHRLDPEAYAGHPPQA